MSATLAIDVISDVVCPWCYIGKRFLEQAIALKPEIPVEVRFRPYFLNPWVPREGMSREDYLIAKFGSVERYNSNNNRVVEAAAAIGLSYNRDRIKQIWDARDTDWPYYFWGLCEFYGVDPLESQASSSHFSNALDRFLCCGVYIVRHAGHVCTSRPP